MSASLSAVPEPTAWTLAVESRPAELGERGERRCSSRRNHAQFSQVCEKTSHFLETDYRSLLYSLLRQLSWARAITFALGGDWIGEWAC